MNMYHLSKIVCLKNKIFNYKHGRTLKLNYGNKVESTTIIENTTKTIETDFCIKYYLLNVVTKIYEVE